MVFHPEIPSLKFMNPPAVGEVLRVVEAPLHKSVPALLVIIGASGLEPVLIVITLLTPLEPQLLVSNA